MQRPHGRLTKQDLKEDEVMVWMYHAWGFLEQNYTRILAGLGAVIAVALIVVFVRHRAAQDAQAAVDALGEMELSLFQGNVEEATAKAEEIADRYEGKPGAQQALAALGNIHYSSSRFSEAKASYTKYLDVYGSGGSAGFGAWTGIAGCLEEEGKHLEAADQYAAYAEKHPGSPFAPLALKEAARCYKLTGNLEKASEALQQMAREYPASSQAREADSELKQMGVVTN